MELQINSLETRIEMMQEKFNKDLEEIKKSKSIMNNAVTEIKNTLDKANSRITEAEDKISEVEYRMMEINEAERKKEKRIKRNEDNLRNLWDNVKCPNIRIIGVPEEEDKQKGHEKILEETIVENLPKMGRQLPVRQALNARILTLLRNGRFLCVLIRPPFAKNVNKTRKNNLEFFSKMRLFETLGNLLRLTFVLQ